MPKVTRVDERWLYHHSFNDDRVLLIARYQVEGCDRQLETQAYYSPESLEGEEGEQVKAWALETADVNAQWAAEHQDDVPTYSPIAIWD